MVSKKGEELQEKAYEFELLRQQLGTVNAELQELNSRLVEFERVKLSLIGLNETKPGDELVVPLGEGLFIKANIKGVSEVLLGVGNNVVLGKGIDKALEYVQERIDEADNLINRLNNNAEYFTQRLRVLEPELRRLTLESRKKE